MTKSLDSVLADVDASEQEIAGNDDTAVKVETEQSGETEGEAERGEPERDAHGALHAERNRVREKGRRYTEQVAEFDRKLTETTANFDKKMVETLAERDRQWEQRFNQFAQQTLQPRKEPEQQTETQRPDVWENPDGFVEHGVKAAVDPVRQEVSDIREHFSRRDAIREHGQEKVQAAFQALHQAAVSGDPEARNAVERVKKSMDPFGDIVAWHQRTTVISEVGNDPQAFIQKQLDAALNDPAFLARAAEKIRGGGKPAQQQRTAPNPSLPSLNRVTAAADEDDEEEDAGEVFNASLRAGANRR